MRVWILWALVAAGCIESQSVYCASGRVCSPDRVCDDVHDSCVLPEQLTSCIGVAEDMPCTIGGALVGICSEGVCVDVACGDGVVSGLEDCEIGVLDVSNCTELGYYEAGPVTCSPSCRYDVSACTRRCGDGIVDPEEQCEGVSALSDCTDHGFYDTGPVACTSCLYDVNACVGRCGDGIRNGDEICDGSELPLLTCSDLGFERGRIGCQSCAADLANCRRIGWVPPVDVGLADWQSAWSAGPGHVIAVGPEGAVVEVTGGQATHATITGALLRDVWGSASGELFVVDDLGGIWRKSAGAWTASRAQVGTNDSLHAIAGTAANDVWAAGDKARILRFDGTSWTEVHIGTAALEDIWVGAGGKGLAVGASGTILRRTGSSWAAETSNTTTRLTGVWSDGSTAVAVGDAGTILRHDGTSWSAMTSGITSGLSEVYGRSANDLYAVGASGVVLHFDGATWWRLDATTSPIALAGITGNAVETYAVGTFGTLLQHEASWSRAVVNSLVGDAAGAGQELVAAGRGVSCGVYRRGQGGWTQISTMCADAVWVAPDGTIFAGDGNRGIGRFDGQTWTVTADIAERRVDGIWGASTNDIWAFDIFGGLVHWNGSTWSPSTLDDVSSIHGSSANDVYAVGGDIWHWDGSTWTDVTPPGVFTTWQDVWVAAPDNVWVVGFDGKILHYNGTAWTDSPSGTTATLVAVAGSAPDDIWAVGGGAILHFDGAGWTAVKAPVAADFYDVVVRPDIVLLAAWDDGLITLVREVGAW